MKEIKRIQLRGISRSPSDRLTEDGGVAESLNMILDNTENAPVVQPDDVTSDLGLPTNKEYDLLYIHSGVGFETGVCKQDRNIGVWSHESGNWNLIPFIALNEKEAINDIKALGNALIISTSENVYYVLRKTDGYKFLGTNIPFPEVQLFDVAPENKEGLNTYEEYLVQNSPGADDFQLFLNWNEYSKDADGNEYNSNQQVQNIIKTAWSRMKTMRELSKKKNALTNPIMAKYAIRLQTGEYIDSDPFLIGGGLLSGVKGIGAATRDANGNWTSKLTIKLACCYHLCAFLRNPSWFREQLENWKDVVKSLDIFISTDIFPNDQSYDNIPVGGSERLPHPYGYAFADTKQGTQGNTSLIKYDSEITFGNFDEKEYEQVLLSKNNFYLVKSFELVTDNGDLNNDVIDELVKQAVIDTSKVMDNTNRVLEESLPYTYRARHGFTANNIAIYNSRVLLSGISSSIPTGPCELSGRKRTDSLDPPRAVSDANSYRFKFFVRGYTSVLSQKGESHNGEYFYTSEAWTGDSFTWLTFPDSRCHQVAIEKKTASGETFCQTFDMKPHPYLPCAYLYLGAEIAYGTAITKKESVDFDSTNPYEREPGKIYQSEVENPFVYPLEGRYTVGDSEIINVQVATTALSQGQFGQFPLYVFTKDGVWAMETGADGSFVTSKPLSREICVNPKSIISVDDSALFVTEKGLMVLHGSNIVNLSPFMNGRHYTIEPTAQTIIDAQEGFAKFSNTLKDATPFMAFMKKASLAYDYAGQRVICVAPDEDYQYVYKFDTQTWHKLAYDFKLESPLNSYPRCLILAKDGNYSRVYDFSTLLDVEDQKPTVKGVITTRPFDLGAPDVYKTITNVRVRGQFPKTAVKFILLGSNDGVNFYTISTLRGKSWKMFRLVILADLNLTDRISWVDVEYETRFTNKLR